jgi:two-component system, OmpR family, sensor histidine kinase VicK
LSPTGVKIAGALCQREWWRRPEVRFLSATRDFSTGEALFDAHPASSYALSLQRSSARGDYFPKTGFLIWDERCKALFGLPPDATVDYDVFLAGLHPDDRERTDEMVKRALDPSGDGMIDIEYRTIGLSDRIKRWVHATGRTFFEDGVPVRFVGTAQGITDRKRADEAVLRLAAIVESSEDAIVSKDLNGIIMSWNQGAERIFGYRADEVLRKPITILIPPDRPDEEPEILRRVRQGQRVEHYETVRRRKDGTLVDVSLTVSPVKDPKGRIIGVSKIARDITSIVVPFACRARALARVVL